MSFYISSKTRRELAAPAPKGQRHEQAKKIICSLVGQGLCENAIFAEVRSKYDSDVSDKELRGLISWAKQKNFQPCSPRHRLALPSTIAKPIEEKITSEKVIFKVEKFLKGFRCDEADLWHASPWRPLEDWEYDGLILLAGLYCEDEYINIVSDFVLEGDKTKPVGKGETFKRDEWMRRIHDHGAPRSRAGAWIRLIL